MRSAAGNIPGPIAQGIAYTALATLCSKAKEKDIDEKVKTEKKEQERGARRRK